MAGSSAVLIFCSGLLTTFDLKPMRFAAREKPDGVRFPSVRGSPFNSASLENSLP